MDITNRLADQLVSSNLQSSASRPSSNQPKKDNGNDFDSMVRQKQQTKQGPVKKTVNGKSQSEMENADTDNTPKLKRSDVEVTTEQYSNLAAMLYQLRPGIDGAVLSSNEAEEESTVKLYPMTSMLSTVKPDGMASKPTADIQQVVAPIPTGISSGDIASYQQQLQGVQRPQSTAVEEMMDKSSSEDDPLMGPALAAQVTEQTPVFENVVATPVKVAEPNRAIPLENSDGIEQLSARLDSFIQTESGDRAVELTLTPENLGKIRVNITHTAEGALHVQLNASSERAVNLLQRGAGNLQNLLTNMSRPAVAVEVRGGQGEEQLFNPNQQSGQQQSQQQQQQQQQQSQQQQRQQEQQVKGQVQDFVQQLRLGLLDSDS